MSGKKARQARQQAQQAPKYADVPVVKAPRGWGRLGLEVEDKYGRDALDALIRCDAIADEVARLEYEQHELVDKLRRDGVAWRLIAQGLGMSVEGARRKYGDAR